MQYHPDKQNGDVYAQARFNEIKEAYEVLIHPQRKEDYLQQRWLLRARGAETTEGLVTAPHLLKKCLELNQAARNMDLHRMHAAGLTRKIRSLLRAEVVDELIQQQETEIHPSIVKALLPVLSMLPSAEMEKAAEPLLRLSAGNQLLLREINKLLQDKKERERWQRMQVPFIVALTFFLCWMMYKMSH